MVGDLTTARIMIEDGAYFKGSIEIDKTGDASSSAATTILINRRTPFCAHGVEQLSVRSTAVEQCK